MLNRRPLVLSGSNGLKIKKYRSKRQRRAFTTQDTRQQILGQELQNIKRGIALNLPPIRNMKSTIRSQRQDWKRPLNPLKGEDTLTK